MTGWQRAEVKLMFDFFEIFCVVLTLKFHQETVSVGHTQLLTWMDIIVRDDFKTRDTVP